MIGVSIRTDEKYGTKSGHDTPLVDCSSITCQPFFVCFRRFTWDFVCSCFLKCIQVFSMIWRLWRARESSGRTDTLASCPARPRFAPPPSCAPLRFDQPVVFQGFFNRQAVFRDIVPKQGEFE